MFRGIDVSKYQGKIDWESVKSQIDFAIIRAGYGSRTVDPYAERNITECERLNIPYGLYWFSYAYTPAMAEREATALLTFVGSRKPKYPLYFDFEGASLDYAAQKGVVLNKESISEIVHSFCKKIEAAGFYVGVYTNEDFRKNKFDPNLFKAYDMWYARYCRALNFTPNIWQYTSSGLVMGIKGNVDRNACNVDYPALMVKAHKNGY